MVRDWVYVLEEAIIASMSPGGRSDEVLGYVIEIMKDVDLFVVSMVETMVRDSRGLGFDPFSIAAYDEEWMDREHSLCDRLGPDPVPFTDEEKNYFVESLIPKLEMMDL